MGNKLTVTIAFISQKGGVGKSVLARGTAKEASSNGLNALLADLDVGQLTSLKWSKKRAAAGIKPSIQAQQFPTAKAALAQASNHDLLIIDGPAKASEATLEIAKEANVVIHPTGGSEDDLEPAVLLFHDLVREGIPKEKLCFALVKIASPAEEAEAREYIAAAGYTVLKGCLPERLSYRLAHNAGLSITETAYPSMNQKADELLQNIIDKI